MAPAAEPRFPPPGSAAAGAPPPLRRQVTASDGVALPAGPLGSPAGIAPVAVPAPTVAPDDRASAALTAAALLGAAAGLWLERRWRR